MLFKNIPGHSPEFFQEILCEFLWEICPRFPSGTSSGIIIITHLGICPRISSLNSPGMYLGVSLVIILDNKFKITSENPSKILLDTRFFFMFLWDFSWHCFIGPLSTIGNLEDSFRNSTQYSFIDTFPNCFSRFFPGIPSGILLWIEFHFLVFFLFAKVNSEVFFFLIFN